MIKIFLDSLSLVLMTATFATVYRGVLAYEPITSWWWKFGNRFEDRWFFNPIWGCEKCISGQLALWSYLFTHVKVRISTALGPYPWNWALSWHWEGYSFIGHMFTITGAIFLTIVFTHILNKTK